jgi:hypothetical protein
MDHEWWNIASHSRAIGGGSSTALVHEPTSWHLQRAWIGAILAENGWIGSVRGEISG